jgi:kynureninase
MTEVLNADGCKRSQALLDVKEWQACGDESIDLDVDKLTWMAIDISPDRKNAALVGAQKLGSESICDKAAAHMGKHHPA